MNNGEIVKYNGELVYQDGDRVIPMQRQDLAEKFMQIMQGLESGIVSRQQHDQAFMLLLQEERKAQSEALQVATRYADTAIALANQQVSASDRDKDRLERIALEAIRNSKTEMVFPWYAYLSAEHLTLGVMAFGFAAIVTLGLIKVAFPDRYIQPSIPVSGVNRVNY